MPSKLTRLENIQRRKAREAAALSVAVQRSPIGVKVVAPGPFRCPTEHALSLRAGYPRGIYSIGGAQLDPIAVVARQDFGEIATTNVIRRGDIKNFVPRKLGFRRQHDGVGQVIRVDVAPQIGAENGRISYLRPEVALIVVRVLHPAGPKGDAPDVGALDRGIHQLLAKVLRQRIGILRMDRMQFINRCIVGQEIALRKEKPGNRLAGDVDEPLHTETHGGFQNVEGGHEIGVKDHVGRIRGRFRNGSGMHDRIGTPDHREGLAGIAEIGHLVVRGTRIGSFEAGPGEVNGNHLVAGSQHRPGRGTTNFAVRSSDDNFHNYSSAMKSSAKTQPANVQSGLVRWPLTVSEAGLSALVLRLERSRRGAPPLMSSITVVIPVKNDATLLNRCLLALAKQTLPATEIIVVDNGSTDTSAAVAHECGARVVSHPGGGIPAASAAGYDAASGEIIARLDADCLPAATWLETIHRELLQHPDAAAVTGAAHFIDGPRLLRAPLAILYLGSYFLAMRAALGHLPLFGSNLAMRRSAWLEVRDSVHRDDPRVHDDVDLSMHLGPIREIIYSRSLSMGISMRPFSDFRALIYRFHRGQYTITRHWPRELPPLRYLRRATGNAQLGTGPRRLSGADIPNSDPSHRLDSRLRRTHKPPEASP